MALALEAVIIKEILKHIRPKRRFKVWWEYSFQCIHKTNRWPLICCPNQTMHKKAVVQLRRKFWGFLNWWLHHDFTASFVEGFVQIDFIDGNVLMYQHGSLYPHTIVSLAEPDAFHKIGQEILRQTQNQRCMGC